MEMTNPKWNELLTRAVNEPGLVLAAYTAFHNYSIGNQVAAMSQCMDRGITPGPVNTYKGWLGVGRQVQRGSKALWLCMPMTFKDKTKLDKDGKPKTGVFFQWKPFWFVLAQTEGDAVTMPELPEWNKDRAMTTLGITQVEFENGNGNVMGYAKEKTIAISPLSPLPLKTLFHELAHVVLGHTDVNHSDTTTRSLREVEAESVAMIVLESLNQPGAEFCRGYIQGWLEGESIPDASAARIFGAADRILKSGYAGKVADNVVE